MIDYEVLRFIWWLLIGVLLIGFAVTDGFDMGVGMLTRFLGRNDTERRIMINSIAPPLRGSSWLIRRIRVKCLPSSAACRHDLPDTGEFRAKMR